MDTQMLSSIGTGIAFAFRSFWYRLFRTYRIHLSLFAPALFVALTVFVAAPLSASAAAPTFGGQASAGAGSSTRSSQSIVLNDLGVVKIVSIKGIDQDTGSQDVQVLNDGATWTVTSNGALVLIPSDASGFPEIHGQIATQSDKNEAFPYKASYVEQANDGTFVGVALSGTLFQQNGHTYMQVDEQLGSGTSSAKNLQVVAEFVYFIEVAAQ